MYGIIWGMRRWNEEEIWNINMKEINIKEMSWVREIYKVNWYGMFKEIWGKFRVYGVKEVNGKLVLLMLILYEIK